MTKIRTIAAHDVVAHLHPRPITEKDELGIIVGSIIDGVVTDLSYASRQGRRIGTAALLKDAAGRFDRLVEDADLPIEPEVRATSLAQVAGVLHAFRGSPLLGLPRPKSRLMVLNGEVGVYAQPDFWDGHGRFFEMKSYRPVPLPPDVLTQVRLFHLAFPGYEGVVVGFARHEDPVTMSREVVPAPPDDVRAALLRTALGVGRAIGKTTVLEFVDHPMVPYQGVEEPGPGDVPAPAAPVTRS